MTDLAGGSLMFVEHLRLNAQIRAVATVNEISSALSRLAETWWFNAGSVGFGLLVFGVHLGASALDLDHNEIAAKRRQAA